ncbi:hypothetical protein LTR36_005452 [Oleoguttula mirabilis]|uniref:MT-A70-domain-containing protein n=1 Tax=Oleoguttula mirabilis TaxID=1507867 RepID=A0AAV9JFL0_9PEZI|nr:hypothetical protein LTR36_005452 [Oleoguttula mirabilis]
MASPILWQNKGKTVTLLDIPRSIAAAQGTLQQPCHDHVLSAAPLHAPFLSNEPKSEKARVKLRDNTMEQQLHEEYARLLEQAVQEARGAHAREWCLPRPYVQDTPRLAKKRKLSDIIIPSTSATSSSSTNCERPGQPADLPPDLLPSLAHPGGQTVNLHRMRLRQTHSSTGDSADEDMTVDPRLVANASASAASLAVSTTTQSPIYRFRIPAQATCYLSDCSDARSFRAAIRAQAQQRDTRKAFDCILLDPPWPNRSVKRTHQTAGSTYATLATLHAVRAVLLGMDVDMLMAEDCLVGVWITNRPAVRDLVLGAHGGLFACWGVELVEEWVWLKTTAHGEPVTQLDALWRKPYEVLLLGRKQRRASSRPAPPGGLDEVKRRVILSVPDLHSRKPCLKALVEPLMADADDYRALEVFARHLVAGWWSWGDECIKFNWEGCWRGEDAEHTSPD